MDGWIGDNVIIVQDERKFLGKCIDLIDEQGD
jgi:hypothetical protein